MLVRKIKGLASSGCYSSLEHRYILVVVAAPPAGGLFSRNINSGRQTSSVAEGACHRVTGGPASLNTPHRNPKEAGGATPGPSA